MSYLKLNFKSVAALIALLAVVYQDFQLSDTLHEISLRGVKAPKNGTFKTVGNSGVGSVAAILMPNNIVMSMSRGNGGGPLYVNNAKTKILTAEYDTLKNVATGQTLSTDIWSVSS